MSAASLSDYHRSAVRLWLLAVAGLVFAMVLVGGATRLTESGLSIVEWRPVTGALPPLSAEEWRTEFEKYKTIPQYRESNRGMTLDQFKTIYWWEWTHRFLGRLIGVAFLLPFLWFLWRGFIGTGLRARLWGIFALGAVQGAVGWWMVASGLADRVSVSQYRLAFHLTLACVIYAAILWVAVGLGSEQAGSATRASPRKRGSSPDSFINAGSPLSRGRAERRLSRSALGLLALVLLQIYLGALVAGLDAGLVYNTWPLIDGSFIPAVDRLFFITPAWRNFFENELTVQFAHRMLAYGVWALALMHALDAWRTLRQGRAVSSALLLAFAVTLQAALGIITLLWQAPLGLALAHQAMAMAVLTLAVIHAQPLAASSPVPCDLPDAVFGPAEKL